MSEIAKNQQELLKQGYSIEEVQKLNLKIEEADDEEDIIDLDQEEDA
jgi:SOS response regulatory protein OraA/RecX